MENSAISWTHHTFNPWIGCSKVAGHPGCAFCYAEADQDLRRHRVTWGPHGTRSRTSDAYWRQPFKWERQAAADLQNWQRAASLSRSEYDSPGPYERPRVFCASLADVFEDWRGEILNAEGVPMTYLPSPNLRKWLPRINEHEPLGTMHELRLNLFAIIDETPHLDWLLLTKRPENIKKMWPMPLCSCDIDGNELSQTDHDDECASLTGFRPNVWLGTSASEQKSLDKVLEPLKDCRELSPVLFLSLEPLLGECQLWPHDLQKRCPTCNLPNADGDPQELCHACGTRQHRWVDWVILGGESGKQHRECPVDELVRIAKDCEAFEVPVWVKQDSGPKPGVRGRIPFDVWHQKELPRAAFGLMVATR